jgi:hypothetical protein
VHWIVLAIPVVAMIVCIISPWWLRLIIVVLDAIWFGLLFAFFAGYNPDAQFGLDHPWVIVLLTVTAVPMIYELVWAFAKKFLELRTPR